MRGHRVRISQFRSLRASEYWSRFIVRHAHGQRKPLYSEHQHPAMTSRVRRIMHYAFKVTVDALYLQLPAAELSPEKSSICQPDLAIICVIRKFKPPENQTSQPHRGLFDTLVDQRCRPCANLLPWIKSRN